MPAAQDVDVLPRLEVTGPEQRARLHHRVASHPELGQLLLRHQPRLGEQPAVGAGVLLRVAGQRADKQPPEVRALIPERRRKIILLLRLHPGNKRHISRIADVKQLVKKQIKTDELLMRMICLPIPDDGDGLLLHDDGLVGLLGRVVADDVVVLDLHHRAHHLPPTLQPQRRHADLAPDHARPDVALALRPLAPRPRRQVGPQGTGRNEEPKYSLTEVRCSIHF